MAKIEQRIQPDHPIRTVKFIADHIVGELSPFGRRDMSRRATVDSTSAVARY
jgi:hypothetical protein